MAGILEQIEEMPKASIKRNELSRITQSNLDKLESYGYKFEDWAFKIPVEQRESLYTAYSYHRGGKDKPFKYRTAYSYVIYGTGPKGEDVVYARWETASAGAGQTLIYIDGKKYYATSLIASEEVRIRARRR